MCPVQTVHYVSVLTETHLDTWAGTNSNPERRQECVRHITPGSPMRSHFKSD